MDFFLWPHFLRKDNFLSDHNSQCNILVVEDEKQLEKILKVKSELTDLKAIVQYTGIPKHEGE